MKRWLRRPLLWVLLAGALAWPAAVIAQNVLVYREQGGARMVVASGGSLDVASGGEIDIESGGRLEMAGTAITSDAGELNKLDGVTAGTVTASKAVVVDGSKNVDTMGVTGAFTAATPTVSGQLKVTGSGGSVPMLTVGDGTPSVAQVAEGSYFEGPTETDGAARFDGAVTLGDAAADVITVKGQMPLRRQAKAAASVLTAADCGSVISNAGGSDGAVIYYLPEASTLTAGCSMTFVQILSATNIGVRIDPESSDLIAVLTNAAGDQISASTQGNTVRLMVEDGTNWVSLGREGTWADGN